MFLQFLLFVAFIIIMWENEEALDLVATFLASTAGIALIILLFLGSTVLEILSMPFSDNDY